MAMPSGEFDGRHQIRPKGKCSRCKREDQEIRTAPGPDQLCGTCCNAVSDEEKRAADPRATLMDTKKREKKMLTAINKLLSGMYGLLGFIDDGHYEQLEGIVRLIAKTYPRLDEKTSHSHEVSDDHDETTPVGRPAPTATAEPLVIQKEMHVTVTKSRKRKNNAPRKSRQRKHR